ncbi:VGLL4 protein, partial [Amia calva]|nr:VGLL4 protein [Amia calva]
GQPSLRTEDRYRHLSGHRAALPSVYPIKRKHSPERSLAAEERPVKVRRSPLALISNPATARPPRARCPARTSRPTAPLPLAYSFFCFKRLLIEIHPLSETHQASSVATQQANNVFLSQIRPSVITCVTSSSRLNSKSPELPSSASVMSPPACDPVVEEHFRRSLGVNYRQADSGQHSVSVSVDDHFAKALGDKWLQIKASPPPASPSYGSSPS